MKQMDLFDICENNHGGNPESYAARSSLNSSEIRRRVLGFIQARGPQGATSDEIEQALGLSHQTASARCSELKAEGKVCVVGSRKTRSGSKASVLVATSGRSNWPSE